MFRIFTLITSLILFVSASLYGQNAATEVKEQATEKVEEKVDAQVKKVTEPLKQKKEQAEKKKEEEEAPPPTSEFSNKYFVERLSFGMQAGKAVIAHDYIESPQGFVSILVNYKVGDMLFPGNLLLKGFLVGLGYDAVSALARKDKIFYRTTSNILLLNAGLEVPLTILSSGARWKEDVTLSGIAGLGMLTNNTLDDTKIGNAKYDSKIDGDFVLGLRGVAGYKFYGPWRVNFNIGVELGGSTFISLFGLGLHSGF